MYRPDGDDTDGDRVSDLFTKMTKVTYGGHAQTAETGGWDRRIERVEPERIKNILCRTGLFRIDEAESPRAI